jgi:hypothetical protein
MELAGNEYGEATVTALHISFFRGETGGWRHEINSKTKMTAIVFHPWLDRPPSNWRGVE